jgi:cell wall-associated NlpC family hydrolase
MTMPNREPREPATHRTRIHQLIGTAVTVVACALAVAVPAPAGAVPITTPPSLDGLTAGPATAPTPGTLKSAQAQASALRKELNRLGTVAETAGERYSESKDEYQTLVVRSMLAERQLDEIRSVESAAAVAKDDRVRAIYMAGGRAGMVNTVLGSASLTEAGSRIYTVSNVVVADRANLDSARELTRQATRIQADLTALTVQQEAAQAQAERSLAEANGLIAQRKALLERTEATVRVLAEQERIAAERAAALAATAALARARGATTSDLANLPPDSAAPNSIAAAAVAAAKTRLGMPYIFGAEGPDTFDCSGLVQWAYNQAGLKLPRTARPQYRATRVIPFGSLAPGDLLFWANDTTNWDTIHHVAMYVGNGYMIAAPQPGEVVKIQRIYLDGYFASTRPVG